MKELMESRNVPLVRNFFYSISFRVREMAELSITIALHEQMQDSFVVHPVWNQVVSSFMEIKNMHMHHTFQYCTETCEKHSYQQKRKRLKGKTRLQFTRFLNGLKNVMSMHG